MVVYEGRIANYNEDFFGQIVVNTETGLIDRVVNFKKEEKKIKSDVEFNSDCIIFPGFLDIHIHAREDETGRQCYKEEYKTCCDAALNGGVGFIVAMPNTPNPLVTLKQLKWHREKIKRNSHSVGVMNYVGIGNHTKPLDLNVPYKLYAGPTVGDLFFRGETEIENALKKYRRKFVSFHVEDFDVLEKEKNREDHTRRRPKRCVIKALKYLLPLIEKYEIKAKLCHWSVGEDSFNIISEYRERMKKKKLGCKLTVEISPMHLLFDYDMLKKKPELWPICQMNPSLQTSKDRLELIKALKSGFIDFLATDHAPHTIEEKFRQFECLKDEYPDLTNEEIYKILKEKDIERCRDISKRDGTSGAPWLDTYCLVCIYLMEKHGFTAKDISRIGAKNPGDFVNNFTSKKDGKGFGEIREGFVGNLTVINTNKPYRVNRDDLKTKSQWSPLEGWKFKGSIERVIIRGREENSKFNGKAITYA